MTTSRRNDDHNRYITSGELAEKMDSLERKVPSRWEVRFLILAGMIGSQAIPAHDVANAATSLFH